MGRRGGPPPGCGPAPVLRSDAKGFCLPHFVQPFAPVLPRREPTCQKTSTFGRMRFVSTIMMLLWFAGPQESVARESPEPAGGPGARGWRLAAVCAMCLPGQTAANLERHVLWTERAVAQGARFVGFPECSLTGYDFSPETGISLAGQEVRAIVALAKKHDVYISAGLVEKRDGRKFNTQILAGSAGLLGAMRKVNLTKGERLYFTPGTEFPVFQVDGVKVSIAICADATQFETVHVLALRGAQLVFVPHATYLEGTPQSWLEWRTSRWEWFAKESCVYLVGCNNAGRFEPPRASEIDQRFASGALIVDPDGKVVRRSEPATNVETMILADISTAGIEEKRAGLASFNNLAMERFYGDLVKDSPYAKKSGKSR